MWDCCSLTIVHHSPHQTGWQADCAGTEHPTVQLPDCQVLVPGHQGGQTHLQSPHPEHRIPQGGVLSPLLYSLYTHDCVARFCSQHHQHHPTPSSFKFADDTLVVGLISGNNGKAYLEDVANLSLWCQDNSLMLNVSKTKELIVDFRRTLQHQRTYTLLWSNGTAVAMLNS